MKDLMIDLQDEIRLGSLSFREIAHKYHVPMSWVNEAWELLCQQEHQEAEMAASYSHDHLERDCDEPYEPDCDSWYDQQYELED